MRRWMLFAFTAATFGLSSAVAQPPTLIGPPRPVVPPVVAPAPTTPVVIISEFDGPAVAGCATCAPQTMAGRKIAAHFSRPRPAPECYQCGTFACEWRFFLGSCRAYFDEGRFAPALPVNPAR